MRPKLLEIEGLQSFRDNQKIDFTTLSETGLFGIFGPTGSGKSTILDAITFVLYGDVKRAKSGTQGIINTNRSSARVSFTFELFKDGLRKNYRVERVYQRKKGSEFSCEAKIARLIEITDVGDIPLCDKPTEVTNTVQELLGLNETDFTRAVVLPQNSFQEFLLLNNSDRRSMLERIFYLEEYGRELLDKLSRKLAKTKSCLDSLSGELKGYEDASDEALLEAKKGMESSLMEKEAVLNEFKRVELIHSEAKEVWTLVQELLSVEEAEQKHLVSQEAIASKKNLLDWALKAEGLQEPIRKNWELRQKLIETEEKLIVANNSLPGAKAGLIAIRQKQDILKKEVADQQPKLLSLKARLEDAIGILDEVSVITRKLKELQASADKLKEIITYKNGLIQKETEEQDALEQELTRFNKELDTFKVEPEYRQHMQEGARLENDRETNQKNSEALEDKVTALKQSVTGLDQKLYEIRELITSTQKMLENLATEKQKQEAEMPEDKNTILKKTEKLHALQSAYELLCFRNNQITALDAKITKQKLELDVHNGKTNFLIEAQDKATAFYEQCRQNLEKSVQEMDRDAACRLAQTLIEGEACPVCGSDQHPRPAVLKQSLEISQLDQRIRLEKEKLIHAEKEMREAERITLVADEQTRSFSEQLLVDSNELALQKSDFESEKQKLPDALRHLALNEMHLELERMNTISRDKMQAIEAWEKAQDSYREQILKLNETLSDYKITESGLMTELKVNRENFDQLSRSLIEAKQACGEVQQKISDFMAIYPIISANKELKRLSENDHHLHRFQKEIDQAQKLIREKSRLIKAYQDESGSSQTELIKVESEIHHLSTEKRTKEIGLKELAGDARIEDEIRRVDEQLADFERLQKEYDERIQGLEKVYNELETQKSLLLNQQHIHSENLKQEENRLKSSLADRGFISAEEAEKALISKEDQNLLKKDIEAYDQAFLRMRTEKATLHKKLQSRKIDEEEWGRINNAWVEAASTKETKVSNYEVAKNRFSTLQEKHDKWVVLNQNYHELNHKHGLYEEIRKILNAKKSKDNSFIDYIAEERLRYVAARASETLGVMTRFKYALELDTENGFIIIDNANGGVHRMVTSLSGGETFMTALSLALALSEQIQLKGQSPLEFFFLDEGFGTLDNSLLDSVIDSLERLSKKERVIGLISHVPELRSRIGRRLIIEPPTTQGEGSKVRIEKS